MNPTDIIALFALLFSVASVLVAIFSWREAQKANQNTLHNTKTFFDGHIASARDKISTINKDILLCSMDLSDEKNKKIVEGLEQLRRATQEQYLTAFNQACNAYLHNRLDKKVFLDEYKDDIERLYKDKIYADLLKKESTNYSALKEFIRQEGILSV